MRFKKLIVSLSVGIMLVLGWNLAQVSASVPGVNEHVDATSGGTIGNLNSGGGTVSHDGRYVAFSSRATNLVPSDTNNAWDIFVRDRTSNTITRVSVASDGTQSNSYSQGTPSISDDGRYVAFESNASNLVSGDTNSTVDVFLHDMQTGITQLLSSSSSGVIGNLGGHNPVISGDGKFVAFASFSNNLVSPASSGGNVYVKNLATGNIQLISKNASGTYGNGNSSTPSISCDGGVVVFSSGASNLVDGDTNAKSDVFVVRRAGGDELTNITLGGNNLSGDASVSCDGMQVVYSSVSTNLVANDTNGKQDIFKYDRRNQTTTLISVDSNNVLGDESSSNASMNVDGRLVAFSSSATNLVSDDTNGTYDIFMRDTLTNMTYRVSVNGSGQEANAASWMTNSGVSSFSNDGKYLYFTSSATNLVANDTNNVGSGFLAQTGL